MCSAKILSYRYSGLGVFVDEGCNIITVEHKLTNIFEIFMFV